MFLTSDMCRILILGFEGVGKKTIIEKTRLGILESTKIGELTVREIKESGVHFATWDLGETASSTSVVPKLRKYYDGCKGLIFVMVPETPLQEARTHLDNTLSEKGMAAVPLLVFVNTPEIETEVCIGAITEGLGLHGCRIRPWKILQCVGPTGEGMYDGMDWMARTMFA